MSRRPLALLVALPAEAKPLNRRFGLRRDDHIAAWPLYRNDDTLLLRCGVGRANAAGATRWLAGRLPADTLWINLGIAGHPQRAVGELLIADTVHLADDGTRWRAELPAPCPCDRAPLYTLDAPDPEYRHPGLCDMEGAGFYPVALAHAASPRLVQCLKIVSDNRAQPARGLAARTVSALIEARLDELAGLFERLRSATVA